jgi:hypothetical protein
MRRPLLIALFILAPLTGCQMFSRSDAPVDKVADVERVYTATVRSLTALRTQGHIGDDDWKLIKELDQAAGASLEAIHAEQDAGNPIDVDDALKGVRALLERLQAYQLEGERVRRADPSNPAGPVGLGGEPAEERQVYRRAA